MFEYLIPISKQLLDRFGMCGLNGGNTSIRAGFEVSRTACNFQVCCLFAAL